MVSIKNIKAFPRVYSFIFPILLIISVSPFQFFLIFFSIVSLSFFPLSQLYLSKKIIDHLYLSEISFHFSLSNPLFVYLVCLIFIEISSTIVEKVSGYYREKLSVTATDNIYSKLHKKALSIDLSFYENSDYFDTLHRAIQEGPHRPIAILNAIFSFFQSLFVLFSMTGLLLFFHWSSALLLGISVLPGIFVRFKYAKVNYRWQKKRTHDIRETNYYSWLITGSQSAKELRLLGFGSHLISSFDSIRTLLRTESLCIVRKRAIAELFAHLSMLVAMATAIAFIIFQAAAGIITIGSLVMFYQGFQKGIGAFQGVLGNLARLYDNNLFFRFFFEFWNVAPKITDPAVPEKMPPVLSTGIKITDLSFTYPQATIPTLRNISFAIRPGEIIAIVGENGSGKSTLTKLLSRLYDPDSGAIYWDGTDIRKFRVAEFRRNISTIFQDYLQFQMTASDNISCGVPETPLPFSRIQKAGVASGIDDKIQSFSNGYHTRLGKLFDGGEELSIGQWQKIAISRALIRNSELIILDEPTASLDPNSEYALFQKFRHVIKGRTAILISHRLSTVRMADRILFMKNGEIIESGDHDTLMRIKGNYYQLFDKQAKAYIT